MCILLKKKNQNNFIRWYLHDSFLLDAYIYGVVHVVFETRIDLKKNLDVSTSQDTEKQNNEI